jgi:hypothetical protein
MSISHALWRSETGSARFWYTLLFRENDLKTIETALSCVTSKLLYILGISVLGSLTRLDCSKIMSSRLVSRPAGMSVYFRTRLKENG